MFFNKPKQIVAFRAINYLKSQGLKKTYYKTLEKIVSRRDYDINQGPLNCNNPKEEGLITQSPIISIIVPVYNTKGSYLADMIESVLAQTYTMFELCLYNAGSSLEETVRVLDSYKLKDPRIKIKNSLLNEGISNNTNKALEMTSGEFVALLDHDDLLHPTALEEVVKVINKFSPDIIYSDEDKITSDGETHLEPHIKSIWAPDTIQSYNYICHFLAVRKKVIDIVGGQRSEFDGSQDYEWILRLSSYTQNIVHIPKILYHWRINENSTAYDISKKEYALNAGEKAVTNFLRNRNIMTEIYRNDYFGAYNQKYETSLDKDHNNDFAIFIYGNFESKLAIEQYLKKLKIEIESIKFFVFNKSINYNYKLGENINIIGIKEKSFIEEFNEKVLLINETYLFFLYDSLTFFQDKWYQILLNAAMQEHISVVSSKILNSKNRIETFGLAIDNNGIYDFNNGENRNFFGYMGRLKISQNVSAVTPEALLVKKKDILAVGGLKLIYQTPIAFIDFCITQLSMKKYVKIIPLELFKTRKSSWGLDQNDLKILLKTNNLSNKDYFFRLYNNKTNVLRKS